MSKLASIFVTPDNEAKLMSYYDLKLSKWPVPYETFDVDTRFGLTHVIASGSMNAPPIVLLHAMGVTGTMWQANIKDLSRNFRVYAIDTIGDIGKSKLDCLDNFPSNGEEYNQWLVDVLDKLNISQSDVIGASMGGWIAMNHAIYSPDRVRRLILLGPMGLPSIFTTVKVLLRLFSLLLLPGQSKKESLIKWALGRNPQVQQAFGEYMLVATDCRGKMSPPLTLSGTKLKKISSSTLLILGENDQPIGSPNKVAIRAKKFIPNISVEIIPNAGHLMNIENPEVVNRLIIDFLQK